MLIKNFYFLGISFGDIVFVKLPGWFVCWPWDSTQSPGFDSRYEQQNIRTKKYLQLIYLLYTSVAKKYCCVTITNKNGLRLGKKSFCCWKTNEWSNQRRNCFRMKFFLFIRLLLLRPKLSHKLGTKKCQGVFTTNHNSGTRPNIINIFFQEESLLGYKVWQGKLWGSFSYCHISTSCLNIIEKGSVILKVHR